MAIVTTDDKHYKAIADAIREKNPVPDIGTMRPDEMASNIAQIASRNFDAGATKGYGDGYSQGEAKGYAEGKESGRAEGYTEGKADGYAEGYNKGEADGAQKSYDDFWNTIQHKDGARTTYSYAFYNMRFDASTFLPKYIIKPVGTATNMMYQTGLTSKDADAVDVIAMEAGGKQVFDTSEATKMDSAFRSNIFKTLGTIDLRKATSMEYMLYCDAGLTGGAQLTRIGRLISSASTNFTNGVFAYQSELEYIGFEGIIEKSIVNLSWSPKLNKETVVKLFGVLSETSTGGTVTFSSAAIQTAFGGTSTEEWQTLRATRPNWTVSIV